MKAPEKTFLVVTKLKQWEKKECREHSFPALHKVHVKVGDTVKVMRGRYKGKIGEISEVFRHNNTVIVRDVNLKTKHMKSREEGEPGQIIEVSCTDPSLHTATSP